MSTVQARRDADVRQPRRPQQITVARQTAARQLTAARHIAAPKVVHAPAGS